MRCAVQSVSLPRYWSATVSRFLSHRLNRFLLHELVADAAVLIINVHKTWSSPVAVDVRRHFTNTQSLKRMDPVSVKEGQMCGAELTLTVGFPHQTLEQLPR